MVDSTPLIPDSRGKKQGHRVLCLCDSRKAVMIINLLALVLVIGGIIAAAVDDTLKSDVATIVGYCVDILFYLIVMFSALQFHRFAVIVAIIWTVASIVWTSVILIIDREKLAEETSNQLDVIIFFAVYYVIHLFVIYVEWIYVSEVGKGIMSRETHSREKYSW